MTFPPPNFVKIDSGLDGFVVYKPVPLSTDQKQEVVDFTCPQCGATISYNALVEGVKCEYCGYEFKTAAEVEGRSAQQFEFTVETMEEASNGWGVDRFELACQNCGAKTSIPTEKLTYTCPFCGSNKVIQNQNVQDILRPKVLIPFQLGENECEKIFKGWLGSHWMTPSTLKNLVNFENFVKIYLPFWTFDSTTDADWKAEVGHPKTEQYYDHGSKSWKTRTRIDWRWESGNVQLKIDDLLVPGTERVSARHLSSVQNNDLSALVKYEPSFLAGMQAKNYDISLEAAWDVARQNMREKTRLACRDQASTGMIRNFRMDLDFKDENWRLILLPFFMTSYRFNSKVFQVLINGQTGKISGQRPVDWTKVWLVVAALLAPGVFLGMLGLLTLPLGGVGAPIGVFGLCLLFIGLVIGIVILVKASQLDDA
jgi:DNA-directed RNA polymerase subunit RPC12/RpoP